MSASQQARNKALAQENAALRDEREALLRALRVILTWADYEDEDGHRPAFDHAAVSALCRKALAAGRGED
jgi:hypothetical protein